MFFPALMLCQLFLINLPFPTHSSCDARFGDLWQPSWSVETRNDLRCSKFCPKQPLPGSKNKSEGYETCCTCHTCMSWEGKEIDLLIEYVSVLGRSLVLSDQAPNETEVYKVEHTDSEMTELPANLCNYDKTTNLAKQYPEEFNSIQQIWGHIVKINFEYNKIRKLSNLNCLVRLDELNVRNNRLTHISNNSINGLVHLRSADFSNNFIQSIDPKVFTSPNLNLLLANLSHNSMTELDVTNMMSLHPFCKIDYESNNITKMVNELEFHLDMDQTYGPGFVDLADTSFKTWPDFKELLFLDDLSQIGHLINFGFDFQGIPLVCDGNLEPFMSLAKDIIETIWRDYMNISCTEPEDLAGIPVYKVEPSLFTSPLLADSNCQTPECTCIDKPNEDTLYIDCSNSGLAHWPKIPTSKLSKFVSLNISGNLITNIADMPYIAKLSMLDISGNQLLEITMDNAKVLENASYLDISNNPNLEYLPQLFQYRNICSTYMKNLQITCDCKTYWIESWLQSRQCRTYDNLFECDIPRLGIHSALDFAVANLECFPTGFIYLLEILIGIIILILIATGTLIYLFRYELRIIYTRIRQKQQNSDGHLYDQDMLLSYNEDNANVTDWVDHFLEPYLIKAGYRVHKPARDTLYGADRDPEVIHAFTKTRSFLVVLTDDYLTEKRITNEMDKVETMRSWTENEWKYGWNNFKEKFRNIVLVNFGHVSSFDINHLQIKAFLRVGGVIDFKNRDRNIMEKICAKLGKPSCQPKQILRVNKNVPQHKLFTEGLGTKSDMSYEHASAKGKHDKGPAEVEKADFNYDFEETHNSIEIELHDIPGQFTDNQEAEIDRKQAVNEKDVCTPRKKTLQNMSEIQHDMSSKVKSLKANKYGLKQEQDILHASNKFVLTKFQKPGTFKPKESSGTVGKTITSETGKRNTTKVKKQSTKSTCRLLIPESNRCLILDIEIHALSESSRDHLDEIQCRYII